MTKIKIEQGAGDDPTELVAAIVAGRKYPFTATITHKAVKPLVVPSTGLCEVIEPGKSVPFKFKNYEQVWAVVTDSAALAKRYENDEKDFVVIEVAGDEASGAPKPQGKAAVKAADAPSE